MWQTRKTGLSRIGLIALCLAPATPAFAWQSRLIWADKSGGLTFRWTSADIQVRKASGKTLYSVRKQVRAEFRQEKPEDRPDQYEVTLKILSVVGPVLSYAREDYRNRMSAAHPSFTFAFVSVDGRRPQKPLTLTDLFPDTDVCKALLADKIVKEVLIQAGVESTPKTSAELANLLDGKVFGTGPTYAFSADLLKHFAFHHIEGDKVAVRLLVRGAGGPSHSSSTQLGLLLPIPARLNRALRQAAAKTQGFLMQDSKTVARGAETKIVLESQSSRPPAAVGLPSGGRRPGISGL